MCLDINLTKHSKKGTTSLKPLTTSKDKVVYKVLRECKVFYKSPYMNFPYKKGFIYYIQGRDKSDIGSLNHNGYSTTINEGFHAYTTKAIANKSGWHDGPEYKTVKCIIPKGSSYYIGMCGDIVSNQLYIP